MQEKNELLPQLNSYFHALLLALESHAHSELRADVCDPICSTGEAGAILLPQCVNEDARDWRGDRTRSSWPMLPSPFCLLPAWRSLPQEALSWRVVRGPRCAAASAPQSAAERRRGDGGKGAPQGGAAPTPRSCLRADTVHAGGGSSCAGC